MFARLKTFPLGKVALVAGVVLLGGSGVAAGAQPTHTIGGRQRPGSVVTSVNGVATAGTCGIANTAGSFTVVGMRLRLVTVEVATTTSFTDSADPSPSFADVCVGNHVKVLGTSSSGTLDATSVAVLPPNLARTKGVVTSVNGVSTAATCGTPGATGTFTFVGRRVSLVTVAVTPATTFVDAAAPTPSFADVCVGEIVETLGTLSSDGALAATSVTVVPPRPAQASGTVASVNGSSATSSCGSSGAAGFFTLAARRQSGIVTVEVTPTTKFTDAADPTPSFADVCVGNHVTALGTLSSTTLTATSVAVVPPNLGRDQGIVTSVNGVSTTGTCGTQSATGTFTLVGNWRRGIVNVEVASTTTFTDPASATASFADICVGVHAGALGTFSSTGTLSATAVTVLPEGPVAHPGHVRR